MMPLGIKGLNKTDYFFLLLFFIDVGFRMAIATSHSFYHAGDLLAPFSVVDKFYNHIESSIDRQQWLLPFLISLILSILHTPNSFIDILHISSAVTAITSSLTLIPIYLIAKRYISSSAGIWTTILIMTNSMFSISSSYFNPSQTYGLLFAVVLVLISFFQKYKDSLYYTYIIGTLAGLSYLIRHEGIILIFLVITFFAYSLIKGVLTRKNAYGGIIITILFFAFNWLSRSFFTSSPLAFLSSTSTINQSFSTLSHSIPEWLKLIHLNINYKLNNIVALVVNITFLGIIFTPIGYIALKNKVKFLSWFLLYWILYELIIWVYMFIYPVATNYFLLTLYEFKPDPAPRYYQLYTPFLLLLMYAGIRLSFLKYINTNTLISRAIHILLIIFCIHQVALSSFYFKKVFAIFDFEHAEFIAAAQYFRDNDIRYANTFLYGADPNYVDFSIIAGGGNKVNCWNSSNYDPNYNCFKKHSAKTTDELLRIDSFDYIISKTDSLPSKLATKDYIISYQNSEYVIYKKVSLL